MRAVRSLLDEVDSDAQVLRKSYRGQNSKLLSQIVSNWFVMVQNQKAVIGGKVGSS